VLQTFSPENKTIKLYELKEELHLEAKQKYLTEAEAPFTPRTVIEEAARCLLCHDAPCSKGCPAGTDPGKFIRSIRFRNFKGAVETVRENNILGGACARICPYDKLCEEACSRTGIDKPIEIGKIQRFITDYEKAIGLKVLEAPAAAKEKVAVIGAGPAGLAVAANLALKGYLVTIFEEKAAPGGVMTYGIVPARLPQDVVDSEIQIVKDLGVEFQLNCKVGKDLTLDELKAKGYAAFFVGIGMQLPKMIEVPGMKFEGVTNAVDFLAAAKPSNGNIKIGENVIVIGGGDVAMDCAATAKLLGAKKVTILYRRSLEEAPANKKEKEYVQSLGVTFATNFTPAEIMGKDGNAVAIKGAGTDGESSIQLKADQIVFAIGQDAEDVKAIADVAVNEKKLIVVDEATCKTNVANIFAAGDIVNGGKTVVEAVAKGKAAADSIDAYLTSIREIGAADCEVASEKEGVK